MGQKLSFELILKTIFEAIEQPTTDERKKKPPVAIHKSGST